MSCLKTTFLYFDQFCGGVSASLLHFLVDWNISIAFTLVLKKTVKQPYIGRFKPDMAQTLAKGRPSQPLGLLFYKKIGLPLEKTEF